jgi:hypothetical protein
MGSITGIKAKIDGIPCLQQFNIEHTGMDNAVACSDSGGGVVRAESNADWRGVAVGFGHTPAKMPGDLFTFEGVDRTGEGWQSAASGTIVDRVTIFCHPQQSKIFYHHIYFSATGSLTPGTYSAPSFTDPNPAPSVQRTIAVDGVSQTGGTEWVLDILGNTTQPVWEAGNSGWPTRGAGNIDATLTWNQLFDDPTAIPQVGDFSVFRAYVTATTYWELQWMHVLQSTGEYVIDDGESRPKFISNDGVARFSGVTNGAGSTLGFIKNPAVATWWPAA